MLPEDKIPSDIFPEGEEPPFFDPDEPALSGFCGAGENGVPGENLQWALYYDSTLESIGDYAFSCSGITELTLPAGIKHIGESAFESSQIKILTIPEGITSISSHAFYRSRQLEWINFPSTLKYKVQLAASFGNVRVTSKPVSLSVTMGRASLSVLAEGTTLFVNDRYDQAVFRFEAKDAALNSVVQAEIKDDKYRDLFEIRGLGDGTFLLKFKDGGQYSALAGKSISVNLNVYLDGNQTADTDSPKANTTVKLKLTIVK